MSYRTRNTLAKFGLVLLGIGATLVATAIHAAINAIGVWIVLEQFDYSLSGGFWSYIIVGIGLAIILNGNVASSDK